jgi:hypothetical protein
MISIQANAAVDHQNEVDDAAIDNTKNKVIDEFVFNYSGKASELVRVGSVEGGSYSLPMVGINSDRLANSSAWQSLVFDFNGDYEKSAAPNKVFSGWNPVTLSVSDTLIMTHQYRAKDYIPNQNVVAQIHYSRPVVENWGWFAVGRLNHQNEEFVNNRTLLVKSKVSNIDIQQGFNNDRWRIAALIDNLIGDDVVPKVTISLDYIADAELNLLGFTLEPRLWNIRLDVRLTPSYSIYKSSP